MNLLIKSQSATPENTEKEAHSGVGAAHMTAVRIECDPELISVIFAWPELDDNAKMRILEIALAKDDECPFQ